VASKKRRRRRRGAGAAPSPGGGVAERAVRPLPEWKWRTFPVYFAFSLGAFIGLYLGLIVAATGNDWAGTAVFVTVALMLGLGLSRLTTRWLVTRRFMQRRARGG